MTHKFKTAKSRQSAHEEGLQWKADFETGLKDVDEQHHHLVDIVNQMGELLGKNEIKDEEIKKYHRELVDYTVHHFREEEKLMIHSRIHRPHLEAHVRVHQSFVDELNNLRSSTHENNHDYVEYLLDFLTHWLAYHILGIDHSMARQIKAINAGECPMAVYEAEEREISETARPLLAALDSLVDLISSRNKQLAKVNQSLEETVAKRTDELYKANQRLEEISSTDVLTGLPNRRHAMSFMNSLWQESGQSGAPLACMMIDADHFKEVNDHYGHDAGDRVLVELAKTLKHSYRSDDIVCRLGGDEFLVICPNTNLDGGMHVARTAHEIVSNMRVATGGEPWHGSISVGVAARTAAMNTYTDLIKAADQAVYIAKQDGKNCVRSRCA